jgi:hypothetical protein
MLIALLYFRFCKRGVLRLVAALSWPEQTRYTRRNRYAVTPLISTCIDLRRLCSPSRWKDLENFFWQACFPAE